jgi:hypothetical protein
MLNLRQHSIIPLDFETYYAEDFTLSRMQTVDYIADPRYQTIGLSLAWEIGAAPVWFARDDLIAQCMDTMRHRQALGQPLIIGAHNAVFDASILSLRYGVYPDLIIDTLSIARTLGLAMAGESLSLANIRDRVVARWPELVRNMPPKGHEVVTAKGKRREDFTPADLAQYGRYACNDQTLLAWIIHVFLDLIPHNEVIWQTKVLKAYTEPRLKINAQVVADEKVRVLEKRQALRLKLMHDLGARDEVQMQKIINSSEKFAQLLRWYGVTPPRKFSPRTKEMTYAFSKKDDEFLELQEHPNPTVALLVEARLGLKSSIEVSRCDAFAREAARGFAPIPYKISGALSHRLGGDGGLNYQNLPSGRVAGQSKAMREAIEPLQPDHLIGGYDSAQVEVRVGAVIANEPTLLEEFRLGECPYSKTAVTIWGESDWRTIKKEAKAGVEPWAARRQISKSAELGCIFGLGGPTLRDYIKVQTGIDVGDDMAGHIVRSYRSARAMIKAMWKTCGQVLEVMLKGGQIEFGGPDGRMFFADGNRWVLDKHIPGVRLPNGVWLSYPELRTVQFERPTFNADGVFTGFEQAESVAYTEAKGRQRETIFIHGAKLYQNLVQATAFALMKYQATFLQLPLVLNSHDEHVTVFHKDQRTWAEEHLAFVGRQVPPWLPNAPIECEVKVGHNYGDLK